MKTLAKGLALSLSMGLASTAATAETLVFASTNPEFHPFNQKYLIPWAEKVNADANGAIELDIRHGPMLANHVNYYDRVVDDVVQMSWGLNVLNPTVFGPTLVATLPFMVDSSEQGSVALCRMYEAGDFDYAFKEVVPILMVALPQSSLHFNGSQAMGMEDLEGKKVMTTSPPVAAIISAYGGAPLSFQIAEQYEALQRGTADGTILNFTALPGFKLTEVLTDHYVAPLGGVMGLVIMARDKWDSLTPEAQAALARHSGCDGARDFGKFIDGWEAEAIAEIEAMDGHTVTYATDEEVEVLVAKMAAGIEAGFAKAAPGGEVLIERFREELAKEAP